MENALELRGVTFNYPGQDRAALDNLSVTLPAGKRIALIGRNGCGKSTFLLHLNGILKPQKGDVFIFDKHLEYDRESLAIARRRVGIVFQNPDDQLFSASVEQDISFGPLNLGMSEGEARRHLQEAACACGIEHLLNRPTHALSYGEKSCVALAGVLAMDPDILVVDELLTGLDPYARYNLLKLLENLVVAGKTIIQSTHDLEIAHQWADLVVVIADGRVVAQESPQELFADPTRLESWQLLMPLFRQQG